MTAILTALLIETGVLVYASLSGFYRLRSLAVIANVAMIALFAQMATSVGDCISAVSAIWYVAAVCGQAIILERYGIEEAKRSVKIVYSIMVVVFILMTSLFQFSELTVDGLVLPLRALITYSLQAEMAFFVAFCLSQIVMILAWKNLRGHLPPIPTMLVCSILCYAVYSPVSHVIGAWGVIPFDKMLDSIVVGFLMKTVFSFALVPAFVAGVLASDIKKAVAETLAQIKRNKANHRINGFTA